MKLFAVSLFFLFTILETAAQDFAAVIAAAEKLEAKPDELLALAKYKEALKLQPVNITVLSKCSQLCSRIGQRQTNTKTRDDYYAAAKIYAETALKISPTDSDANTSMAIMLGRATLTKSGKEKVAGAKNLKKHVDIALKSNPANFLSWHVLGRWHYEISNLSSIEKAAVKVFYGGFPASSLKESITAFEKVKVLAPGFILNYIELAKAYHRNKEDVKAKAVINAMMLLPNYTEDDPSIKEAGKKYLKEW